MDETIKEIQAEERHSAKPTPAPKAKKPTSKSLAEGETETKAPAPVAPVPAPTAPEDKKDDQALIAEVNAQFDKVMAAMKSQPFESFEDADQEQVQKSFFLARVVELGILLRSARTELGAKAFYAITFKFNRNRLDHYIWVVDQVQKHGKTVTNVSRIYEKNGGIHLLVKN